MRPDAFGPLILRQPSNSSSREVKGKREHPALLHFLLAWCELDLASWSVCKIG